MAIARMQRCEKARAFVSKKMSEGKSEKDAVRALKRSLSREAHDVLKANLGALRRLRFKAKLEDKTNFQSLLDSIGASSPCHRRT